MSRDRVASFQFLNVVPDLKITMTVAGSCLQKCTSVAKVNLFHKEIKEKSDNNLKEPKRTIEKNHLYQEP